MAAESNPLSEIYAILTEYYGQQPWWPAEDKFEIMVGAILTQNTAWSNVEKAIKALKEKGLCDSHKLAAINPVTLAPIIRSSGYFNQKSERLVHFSRWYEQQGGYEQLVNRDLQGVREQLLALKGIGPETADDILLYALEKPSFVIDTYTRRLFSRLGLLHDNIPYSDLQQAFEQALPGDVDLFQQFHALIVTHAKQHCLKKPKCKACPLAERCYYEATI